MARATVRRGHDAELLRAADSGTRHRARAARRHHHRRRQRAAARVHVQRIRLLRARHTRRRVLRREIVALSESKRTESYWTRTRIFDSAGTRRVAEMLLNHAVLNESYAGYADATR